MEHHPVSKEFDISNFDFCGNGAAFGTVSTRPAHTSTSKSRSPAHKLDLGNVVPSIHVRGPSLHVDHGVWPTRRRVDGCGAAQMTFEVVDKSRG